MYKFLWIASSIAVVSATEKVQSLIGIPLKGSPTFSPVTQVHAMFANDKEKGGADVSADVSIKTKFPTVNLMNYKTIQGVECTANEVQLTFSDPDSAQKAFTSWFSIPELVLIAAPQHMCYDDKMAFLKVASFQQIGSVLLAKQTYLESSEVVDDFDITLTQTPDVVAGLQKRKGLTPIPLNLNYNEKTRTIDAPDIPIWDFPFARASCSNCHLRGRAYMETNMKGNLKSIKKMKLSLSGELFGSIGLRFQMGGAVRKELGMVTLFRLPLIPTQVSNLFTLGPEIALDVGAYLETAITIGANMNVASLIHFPFNFTIDAAAEKGKPKVKFYGVPSMTPHPLKLKDGSVALKYTIAPTLRVGFTVLTRGIELALRLNNMLGIQVKAPGCEASPVQVVIFREHAVSVELQIFGPKLGVDVWTTGKLPLNCAFCNSCPANTNAKT